jgi:hypothetical protein
MSKSKKHRTPNVSPSVLARPRLDALLARHAQGELSLDALEANVRALIEEMGEGPVLDALVKRMEGTPEAERETLMLLVPRLKSRGVIDHLWQQVKRHGGLSLDAKMTALVILKAMDEEVDLDDPTRYFSPRELRATDLKTAEDLVRTGFRGLARALRGSRDAAEVEAYMHRLQQMPETPVDGKGVLLQLIETAQADGTDLAADFLYALARTTPDPDVRQAAEHGLTQLEAHGIQPVTRAILDLGNEHFYGAYTTDPQHPWQQSIVVGWERAAGTIQALSFLLDFGVPWRGAIKDMFVTRGMTPREFERQFKERAEQKMGEQVYRVPLVRAQAMIAAAVQANQQFNILFPKEYNEVRHLVERWVLHPATAALEADTTRDELAPLPLTVKHEEQPLFLREEDFENPAVQQWLAQQPEATPEKALAAGEEASAAEEAEVQAILRRANYPPPVERLLQLGEPTGAEWRDYLKEGIRREHIPDLIRMATDRELNRAPGTSKIVWAPVHAWRALGQLRAVEAAAPLIGLLRYIDEDDDEWIGEELPEVFGMIGPVALPGLDAYLADAAHPLWARVAAARGIQEIIKNSPEAREQGIASLTRTLEQYAQNDPTLNAFIILPLAELKAGESANLIERAFAAERVDESVMGDWEDVQIELGLKGSRSKPRRGGWLDRIKFK